MLYYYTVIGHKKPTEKFLWSRPMTREQAREDARLLLANFVGACEERGVKIWMTQRDDLRGWQPPGFPTGVEVAIFPVTEQPLL